MPELNITNRQNGLREIVALTDYAAAIMAFASILAALFILFELRHMDKHKNLEISMKLFERTETERLRKAFRWIETDFQ